MKNSTLEGTVKGNLLLGVSSFIFDLENFIQNLFFL